MKIDRSIIEKEVVENLKLFTKSRKLQYELNLKLSAHSIPFGVVQKINKNDETIKELELHYIIGIVGALHDANNALPSQDEYFGKREILEANEMLKVKEPDKITLPYVLKDVIQVKYDSFITKISIKELVRMVNSQLIVYEEETQRGVAYKLNKSGGIVKAPIVNKASVKRIADKVSKNKYFEDMITLNVYSTEVDPVTYLEESKMLTINEGTVISILDGFHRLQGFVAATSINQEADFNQILSIRVYDYETAKQFFSQLNTINVLSKERKKELAEERLSDKVVTELKRKSEIGEQIASGSTISNIAGELTTFDLLSYAVDQMYKMERQFDVVNVTKYLNDFFVYLVGYYPDEFSKNVEDRKIKWMSHPLMFIGYIVLSKIMLDKNIELTEIKKYIGLLEEGKISPMLYERNSLTNNKRIRNKLIEYFVGLFGGDKSE
ncbi:DNA sulfur modification protein DndB [Paenibacillus xylanexedens]|uniref:DNA sulfur modification protein DndB n=1 Tax=Paenibacillus xylanexedens TaxID=528191 RepID=UPI0016433D16|nr:DNA sulfur modification protein DndB [Paenibacillus xylanexedens]